MNRNLIFIFEFVSGGGFSRIKIPTSLFCEGFGMLRSIIADFKALDFEINTILDNRIFFLSNFLQADIVRKVNENDDYITIFKEFVNKCHYTFIIAPETSNILYNLTKIVKNCNKIVLSTNLNGIKYGTSKIKTYQLFKKKKILSPRTYSIPHKRAHFDKDFITQKFKRLKSSIVIKPEDGVGAESIYYFEKESQLLNFLNNINTNLDKNRGYILQEFIDGRNLSISLIGAPHIDENPIILSVNSQDIDIKNLTPDYLGGYTPLSNYKGIRQKLSSILKKINILKIEGYFGIDFIERHNGSFHFIEINPRLTTSYIGLRNVINLNCAELIFKSRFNILRTPEIILLNHSIFTRVDFYSDEFENTEGFYEDYMPKLIKLIPEFVTPPIALDNSNLYSCFIATITKDLNSSKIRINKIFESLKSLNFKVIKPIQKELS
ncbi:MAG: ATP-grasp domain-containing protein [Candidatus Lokiarchaeota archaeon]|nr:ATP-grasp domain-containing protein [Candidatus Lokiarchaeota archaeon]